MIHGASFVLHVNAARRMHPAQQSSAELSPAEQPDPEHLSQLAAQHKSSSAPPILPCSHVGSPPDVLTLHGGTATSQLVSPRRMLPVQQLSMRTNAFVFRFLVKGVDVTRNSHVHILKKNMSNRFELIR
jgi:hypothetical protein